MNRNELLNSVVFASDAITRGTPPPEQGGLAVVFHALKAVASSPVVQRILLSTGAYIAKRSVGWLWREARSRGTAYLESNLQELCAADPALAGRISSAANFWLDDCEARTMHAAEDFFAATSGGKCDVITLSREGWREAAMRAGEAVGEHAADAVTGGPTMSEKLIDQFGHALDLSVNPIMSTLLKGGISFHSKRTLPALTRLFGADADPLRVSLPLPAAQINAIFQGPTPATRLSPDGAAAIAERESSGGADAESAVLIGGSALAASRAARPRINFRYSGRPLLPAEAASLEAAFLAKYNLPDGLTLDLSTTWQGGRVAIVAAGLGDQLLELNAGVAFDALDFS